MFRDKALTDASLRGILGLKGNHENFQLLRNALSEFREQAVRDLVDADDADTIRQLQGGIKAFEALDKVFEGAADLFNARRK